MRRLGTMLAVVLAGLAALPGVAAARAYPTVVRVTASCPTDPVLVQLTDGSLQEVLRVRPGRFIRRITPATDNLFVVARFRGASWTAAQRRPGTNLVLFANGPRGERWRWRWRVVRPTPVDDPSDFLVCLHPLRRGRSFVRHLVRAPGAWAFVVEVGGGRLRGSRGRANVVVAR